MKNCGACRLICCLLRYPSKLTLDVALKTTYSLILDEPKSLLTQFKYFFLGKSDTFCEVYLGSQEHRTKVVPNSLNPKWNASMQFLVKDLKQDVLCVTVLDRDYFSPNGKQIQ